MTDRGLCEGGRAERLFRRMGSTPAAAALLRTLVCPITKVSMTSMHLLLQISIVKVDAS